MAHNEAPDPAFCPNPEERDGGTQKGKTATQRQPRSSGPHPWGWWLGGWRQKNGGTTAVVEAREVHQVLLVAQDAAKGATKADPTRVVVSALGKAPEGGSTAHQVVGMGPLVHLRPLVFGLEHGPRRCGRGCTQEVSKTMDDGASGPETFTLLLRLFVTHFDRVDTGEGYTKLHPFGVCNGTSLSHFSREFRVLASEVTGSERGLFPGTDVVLEVVRMAVHVQFPSRMPLYPGSKATDPQQAPFPS